MPYSIDTPFILIIFGASGDLAKLKLFPALYELMHQKRLPTQFYIIGFARTKKSLQKFRQEFKDSILKAHNSQAENETLQTLLNHVHYLEGQYNERSSFLILQRHIKKLTKNKKYCMIHYFAVPPSVYQDIIENLGETRTNKEEDMRLVIEKPFGEDTKSAEDLFHFAMNYFKEDEIYLLDHYLGKGAVQSLLHLRHGNKVLNLILDGHEISNIQITASESIGVHERAGYFDKVGALKDMVQSHLLQVLALITMSIPVSLTAPNIHREKYHILSSLMIPNSPKSIVIGQYKSYKNESGVAKNSQTETYVALRLYLDRQSWYKIPIYLRTGKKLHEKHTYIVCEIKKFAFQSHEEDPNKIIIELQPEEKISIRLLNRHGTTAKYQEFKTSESIAYKGEDALPEHGVLLLDIIRGRKVRFLSFPEIIATWKLTDRIIELIKRYDIPLHIYQDSTDGPSAQHRLTASDNFVWFDPH